MSVITGRLRATPMRSLHLRWLGVLLTGTALFGAVIAVLVATGDPIYVPCLLLVGAAAVPATFSTLVTEIEPSHRLSGVRILTGAVLGGTVGAVLAGQPAGSGSSASSPAWSACTPRGTAAAAGGT